ncbi:hypothetical protein P4I92_22080 [Bacillus cereus]
MDTRNFVFFVKEYNTVNAIGGKNYEQECAGIGIRDVQTGIEYPSPLTGFIKSQYRSKNISLSNQKNPAYEICKFLNYCREKVEEQDLEFLELKENGIWGLRRKHASLYISDLSIRSRAGQLASKYVKQIIRYLNQFYHWMQSQGLLMEDVKFFYKEIYVKKAKRFVLVGDIFNDEILCTIYPSKREKKKTKLVDFGKYRFELVEAFLDIAETSYPDIYVGICLQFFGGLRKGEVLNLTRNALIKKDEGYLLDVDDRRHILFPDKKNTDAEQVKVPRHQALLWNNRLEYAIKEHFDKLNAWCAVGKIRNNEAFLVNSRSGKPITGKVYWEQFNKIKEDLLEKLSKEGKAKQLNFLTSLPWSTHLARGVFTNFCFELGMSISEVAIARGDSSLSSVLDYVEELAAYETMKEAMNNIRNAFKNQTGKINSRIPLKYSDVWRKQSVSNR